jgi:antitoxin (DNA-binding transcriptional repressor) of toxin-antitoxin stability system
MVRIAIEQFQQNPLAALARVEAGETLLIIRNNSPVAQIKPPPELRPIGLCKGEFTVPDDFDAPLPDDILDLFEGKSDQ